MSAQRLERVMLTDLKYKTIQTCLGKLELQVPQTRGIAFYPQCL
jgi:transposase-like protein